MTMTNEGLDLEERARAIGRQAESLGREAEEAAQRLSKNPSVLETVDLAGRIWGLVLLAAGLWLLGAVTLHMDLPVAAWADLWPVVLIILGGVVVIRGFGRRA